MSVLPAGEEEVKLAPEQPCFTRTMFGERIEDRRKQELRQSIIKETYDVRILYRDKGIWQFIARSNWFEQLTICIICVNAMWIGVETDMSASDASWDVATFVICVDNCFCIYFFWEWLCRFMAFKRKCRGFQDSWFLFDSVLLAGMVIENWLMPCVIAITDTNTDGGDVGKLAVLRMARLLRLTRMARMMRLLRAVPELMILVKGLLAGTASVFMTFALLMLTIYIYAIFFVSLATDYENLQEYFGTVPTAMYTLLMHGAFFEDFKDFMDLLRDESYFLLLVFFIFVMGAGITIMNMLIGVLCEVVGTVADQEREEMEVNFIKSRLFQILIACFPEVEGQEADTIQMTQPQFQQMIAANGAARILNEVGVNVENLVDLTDMIFEDSGPSLDNSRETRRTFDDLIENVMDLRGSNAATVKDVMSFRKFATNTVGSRISRIEKALLAMKAAGQLSLHRPQQSRHTRRQQLDHQVTNHWKDVTECPRMTSAQEAAMQLGGKWKNEALEHPKDAAVQASEETPAVEPEFPAREPSNPSIVPLNEAGAEALNSTCSSSAYHRSDPHTSPDANQDIVSEESARIDAALTEILQKLMARVEHMEAAMQEVLTRLPASPAATLLS